MKFLMVVRHFVYEEFFGNDKKQGCDWGRAPARTFSRPQEAERVPQINLTLRTYIRALLGRAPHRTGLSNILSNIFENDYEEAL